MELNEIYVQIFGQGIGVGFVSGMLVGLSLSMFFCVGLEFILNKIFKITENYKIKKVGKKNAIIK